MTKDEKDGLLQVLRFWGALDKNYEYKKSEMRQQHARLRIPIPAAGLHQLPVDSDPIPMKELFNAGMWFSVIAGKIYEFQTPLFQPVGGMGMIGQAFGKQLDGRDQIQLQSHGHPAGRQRRHRHLYRFQDRRRAAESQGRTGASAPFPPPSWARSP